MLFKTTDKIIKMMYDIVCKINKQKVKLIIKKREISLLIII